MIDLKCSECGCTLPSDTTKCPNCGEKYADVKAVKPKNNGDGITVGRIGYAIKCKVHGRVDCIGMAVMQ